MMSKNSKWYKTCFRRNCIDMHITDWNEKFMSEFDPRKYVEMLVLAKVQSAVVYAHSHTGVCYYPTKAGHMHQGLQGRDVFGEIVDLCHQNGIKVVGYYSLIYDRWAYDTYPDWRIVNISHADLTKPWRYGVCCPNSPYRNHAVAQIKEICGNYELEGIRFDMTFWPRVCYCAHCKKRFANEVGGDLPRTVNWLDPHWVTFQRKRQAWLVEFAELATATAKNINPELSVEHQASPYIASWERGLNVDFNKQSDFLQGDFYGDRLEGSFAQKLFYNLSNNLPYGFETSANLSLRDHTTLKSPELLKTKVYSACANGGAFVFIDAIDPSGTLNRNVYEVMGKIFEETKIFEQYLGGRLCQDVAIYLSTESNIDFEDNSKDVLQVSGTEKAPLSPFGGSSQPHLNAVVSAAKCLMDNNIPFGVITKKNINELAQYQILILPNVLMMDAEEIAAIKKYVEAGGNLYASKYTSLVTSDGKIHPDFLLSDLFGVSYIGATSEKFTYISPAEDAKDIFGRYSRKYPLSIKDMQIKVAAKNGAKILGKICLPYTNPADSDKFASIHSNPPGIATDFPAVILNRYGKGKVLYVTGDIEQYAHHHGILFNLIKLLATKPFVFESDAPKSVELTVFHQEDKKRYIINLLNFQDQMPNIPVAGIKIVLNLQGKKAKRLLELPGEKKVKFQTDNGRLTFTAPVLNTFLMFALEYEVI